MSERDDTDLMVEIERITHSGKSASASVAAIRAAITEATAEPGLDAARLAKALHRTMPEAHQRHGCRDRHDIRAARIAAEYAALREQPEKETP